MKKEKEAQSCVEDKQKDIIYWLSTLKFIPEGDQVSRVLIHLPFITFGRHGSRLVDSSITMTVMSDSQCAPLFKCLVTEDMSVLQ